MSDLRVPISDQDHIFGHADAPVTLVEYGDYQCPHCQAAWPEVERVLRRFGDRLRYIYRHFPLWTVHPMAKPAAEAAEVAGAHGQFWEMHAAIFANGHHLSGAMLVTLARALELDADELRLALEQGVYTAKVDADLLGGARSGERNALLLHQRPEAQWSLRRDVAFGRHRNSDRKGCGRVVKVPVL